MINFIVDKSKCIKCKICVSDCPVLIINGKTEYPEIKYNKENNCLKCQHCLAVCPVGAVSIWNKKPENSIIIDNKIPNSSELELIMQTRRSVRKFKSDEIDKNLILYLLSVASYAPTSKNENSVQFSVIYKQKDMFKLREMTYKYIKKVFDENKLPRKYAYLNNFRELWEKKKIDIIFRNAPHLVIAHAPKTSASPKIDCTIAMTYFDLLANYNKIGTLWNGFAQYTFEHVAPELKNKINIPNNNTVVAVLLFGKPAIKFKRSIQNEPNIKNIRF